MSQAPLILVVEDEVLLALDLLECFQREGYRAAVAWSAAETDEILLHCSPAAAVVDLRLRDGLTGPDIARRLHELGVPVVIHSGERTDLNGLPVAAHLVKPVPPEIILAHVREAIDQHEQS